MDLVCRCFCEAQFAILTGDVLLFRRRSLVALAGRSVYSHAGLAGWWDGDLMALEARASGVRAVPLAGLVARYPSRIDVFALRKHPDIGSRRRVLAHARRFLGRRYGWRTLVRVALVHWPGLRLLFRPDLDNGANGPGVFDPICSQLVSLAWRLGAGVDPVPYLADRFTEPGDLARSVAFNYFCTLLP